jgi:hypothetical protein
MVSMSRFQKLILSVCLAIPIVVILCLSAACSALEDPEQGVPPRPELQVDMQAEEIGPSRTDILLKVTNVGVVDVLLVPRLTLAANAGSDRDYGPTTRAEIRDIEGREIASTARAVKTMTWVPERLRAGVTLTWGVALRCFDAEPITVGALIKSVRVGGVSEAPFDDLTSSLAVTCRPAVAAGA